MMYYDILRQRILLVVKTALQFYGLDKYEESDKDAYRTLIINDVPLSLGGIGDMKIRIVKNKKSDIELFLEGIKETATNGKKTEVVEVPVEFLQGGLECVITDIKLEPENQSDLDKQSYMTNIVQPMLSAYVPAGLADPAKVMMRHMEKFGEAISDFATENVLEAMAGNKQMQLPPNMTGGGPTGQANASPFQGNMAQSVTGTRFGAQQAGPLPFTSGR